MKAGLLTLAALAASVSAQVRRDILDRHLYRHAYAKRADVVVETQVDYVTATAPNAVVYVDGNGNPVSTAYNGAPAPAAQTPPPVQASSAPAAASNSHSKAGSNGSGAGRGIAYSPYNADSSCKTQDQVNSDFEKIEGYDIVRIYGTDCNQVATVLSATKAKGMKVFAGIYDIADVVSEIQVLIDAAKNDWNRIDTVGVGNEIVNAGGSVDSVVSAINTARGLLKTAGYTGSVVTVDTFVAMIANPSLCQNSDYAAANAHAYFDGNVDAAGAGDFVKEQAQRVRDACGGKRVVITETGWPWQGETNGAAVPSRANQQTALASLKSNFSKDIILFTAYDDMWKQNTAATFGCEQFWGFIQ